MDAVKLQNYRSFLERLGEALSQHQNRWILPARNSTNAARNGARSASRPSRLNRVVDRFRKEERSAADRREQREGDDAAMRLMLAARADAGNG